jgi:hypothetical protein
MALVAQAVFREMIYSTYVQTASPARQTTILSPTAEGWHHASSGIVNLFFIRRARFHLSQAPLQSSLLFILLATLVFPARTALHSYQPNYAILHICVLRPLEV